MWITQHFLFVYMHLTITISHSVGLSFNLVFLKLLQLTTAVFDLPTGPECCFRHQAREEPPKQRPQGVYRQGIHLSRQPPLASLPVACRASSLDIVEEPIVLPHLQIRLLCLELCKRLLRVPDPWRGASEEEIHLLESSLVCLGVQGPDYRYRNDIGDSEDVKRRRTNPCRVVLARGLPEDKKTEKKNSKSLDNNLLSNITGQSSVSHPLPMLQPTTPHAFPWDRTWRGKISAGYSQGTVSQVAPNTEVKMMTKAAAVAPYELALLASPPLAASSPSLAKAPARNI